MFHHSLFTSPEESDSTNTDRNATKTSKSSSVNSTSASVLSRLPKKLFLPTGTEVGFRKKRKEKEKVSKVVNDLKDAERARRIKGSSSVWGGLASLGQKKKEKEDKNPVCEITKLLPPSYFGHSCLLESHEVERASVVTETRVAVLRMMVPNLDISFFNHFSREKLKSRMPIKLLPYKKLLIRHKFEKGWDNLKKDLMLEVKKAKWPLRNAIVQVETGGKHKIFDKPKPHGTI